MNMVLKDLLKGEVNVEELMTVQESGDIDVNAGCQSVVGYCEGSACVSNACVSSACITGLCASEACKQVGCESGQNPPPPTSTPTPPPSPTPPPPPICETVACYTKASKAE
jgi:hypothetical protein